MRPQGRAATESLYFHYPQFAPPERDGVGADRAGVVIVGAGPVGMTAALTLARWGAQPVVGPEIDLQRRQPRHLPGASELSHL